MMPMLLLAFLVSADDWNRDESKVPEYRLPDPLRFEDGRTVDSPEDWRRRRAETLELFREHVYGRSPEVPADMWFEVTSVEKDALGGQATRKQVTIHFSKTPDGPSLELLLFVPTEPPKPVPAFLGLNFRGNHTVHPDPGIAIPRSWVRADADSGVVDHRATEAGRGHSASRWPVELLISRGYALATVYYGDIDPDFDDGFENGVHSLFDETERAADSWGSIAAWAWGLSRVMDYLETDDTVDHRRVAVLGHSRLGKTALWAGAQDERFAIVLSNDSGCGGAALSRRRFGETVGRINRVFPHWFCENFRRYDNAETELPIDQHQLISLVAPRPVYVASASFDLWADPKGEFLSLVHAEPVYRLLGYQGIGVRELPSPNQPVHGDRMGYHLRLGKHDLTKYDWKCYLDFADRHFRAP